MLKSGQLVELFRKESLDFVTGVPCSIFRTFLADLNKADKIKHVPATCEGEACALGTGYYLATKKIPVIYMQNSGLGNSVNPLASLLDKEVYGIPALLLISWRGEPGKKDEPEHIKMGRITLELLNLLGIPYLLLSPDKAKAAKEIKKAKHYLERNNSPYAIIVREGVIAPAQSHKKKNSYSLRREEAIGIVVDKLKGDEVVISTTGKTSRELFEYRDSKKQSHQTDFQLVGSMGCASGVALGVALNSRKKVVIIDGDGAVLMKMGSLATIGKCRPKKLIHIVIDNSAYESTGGQPSASSVIDWPKLFSALGYQRVVVVKNRKELINLNLGKISSPAAVVIKVNQESRNDLGRPTLTPLQIKENFMEFLKN